MPQIFRIGPYIVYFWSNEEGEPIHVHVSKGRPTPNATKIWLTRTGGCIVASNFKCDKSVDNQYGQGIAQPQFFQNISPNFEQYDSGDRGQQ